MRTLAGTFMAVALVIGLAEPGAAAVPPLDTLPRGSDTSIPHLVLDASPSIEAPGVDLVLPPEVTAGNTDFALVGRTDVGWLVSGTRPDGEGGTDHDSLHLVTATGSTRLLDFGHFDGSPHYRLSTSGKRVIRYPIGDMPEYLTVYDLAGHRVARHRVERVLHDYANVWDFSGTRVVYGNRSWRIGHRSRVLTTRTVTFADIGHNTLGVSVTGHRRAFATLTHPNRLRWRARFDARMVSPNGSRIVGWALDRRGGVRDVLQVRRTIDGKVLASIDVATLRTQAGSVVQWEGNAAVTFVGQGEAGAAVLVRCTLATVCARVSEPAPAFSLAPRPGV